METTNNQTVHSRHEQAESIRSVTLKGTLVNMTLVAFKFIAGIAGHSVTMIADALHTFSDFSTDLILLYFTRNDYHKNDARHDYGRGKVETLTTVVVGILVAIVGLAVMQHGVGVTIRAIRGEALQRPGWIALAAALVSVVAKEWTYRSAIRVARREHDATIASKAWHHRSDALSSVGAAIGVAGAIFLGAKWRILDPMASVIISLFILRVAYHLIADASRVLTDESLSEKEEQRIAQMAEEEPGIDEVKWVLSRRVGRQVALELYVTMRGDDSVSEAHERALRVEERIREVYGQATHINIHIEPTETTTEKA